MTRWLAVVLALGACTPPCEEGDICQIAGTGDLGFNGDDLPALETRIASPTAVRVDLQGRPMVIDYSNMRIRVLLDDGTLHTIAGNGEHAYSEIGLDAGDTPLENPVDASYGPDGLLYILPQHEGRIIRVEDDGRISLFAATGVLADGPNDVPKDALTMGYTGGMSWGRDGSLYVSDASFSRVHKISPEGVATHILGTGSAGIGPLTTGPNTSISFPERVVVDDARNRLIVADTGNHRVLAVDLDSLAVTLIAGTGSKGNTPSSDDATTAQLYNPVGVEVTQDGTVLIADLDNGVIKAVDPSGALSTVAGMPESNEPVFVGEPLAFPLRRPAGMAWTPEGDLLIAERSGHRVLRWMGAADAL